MNKMQEALREFSSMDTLAALDSPIHRLNPLTKLMITVIYIFTVMSFGKYQFSSLMVFLLWPLLLFMFSGIPASTCFHKLRFVFPLVMAVGLFNPFFDRKVLLTLGSIPVTGGVISMLTLMLKGVLCLMASFLLIATTTIDALCKALRRLHVPGLLVTLLLLTYRYVGVLTGEVAVMTEAYLLRAPGHRGIHISAWGSFLGQLLLRSMDRARELYDSMRLRGYDGSFAYVHAGRYASGRQGIWQDVLWMGMALMFCIVFRYYDLAAILGTLVVR